MQLKTKIGTDISVISGNRLAHNQINTHDCYASVISNDSFTYNNTAYRSTHTVTNHIQQKKQPLRYIHHYPKQVIRNFGKSEQQTANQTRSVYYPLSLPSSEMNICSKFDNAKKVPTAQNQSKIQKKFSPQVCFQEQKKFENVIQSFSQGKLKIIRIDSFEADGEEENDKRISETNSKGHQNQKSKIKMTEQSRDHSKTQSQSVVKKVHQLQKKLKAQDQLLFQKQKQIINLQACVQKAQDSLRINRTIIFNLNQIINYLDKKHQNTLRDSQKNYTENLQKQLQLLRESIFQEQKAKYNQFVQSLQRENHELRQRLSNVVRDINQFKNRQQLEKQRQKSEFFQALASKDQQIKSIYEQKQKEVRQITTYFQQTNSQCKLQILKLEKQLKNLDQQNIRLDQQNIRFFEGNQHLVKQIQQLNSKITNIYKERDDLIIEQSDNKSQIIELNIQRNSVLLQIIELKGIINAFRETNYGQINFKDEKKCTLKQREEINYGEAILQTKTHQINELQKQLKNSKHSLQKKILQLQIQQKINLQKQKQIKMLQAQVCELKLQISLFKSENVLKQKLLNQKMEQFQSKQKNFSELQNEYRQVLEDELKNIEMIDEEYNQNEQIFNKNYQRNQLSFPKQYQKSESSSDLQNKEDEQRKREKLERKIKQLIYINKNLSAKIEQINQKTNFKQIKQLKLNLQRSEHQKQDLQKSFIELNIILRKLANKCTFYQSKIQQLQQNIQKLEIMLENSTDDLMKSGLRLMEIKYAQKLTKQVQQQNRIHKSNSQIFKKQQVNKYIPFKVMQQSNRIKNTPQLNKSTSSKHSSRKQQTNNNVPSNNIIKQNKFQSTISSAAVQREQKNKNVFKRTQQKNQKQPQFAFIDNRQFSQFLPKEESCGYKFKQKSKLTDYFVQKKANNPVFTRFGHLPLQKQSKNNESQYQKNNLFQYLAKNTAMTAQQSQSYRNFLDRELKKMRD